MRDWRQIVEAIILMIVIFGSFIMAAIKTYDFFFGPPPPAMDPQYYEDEARFGEGPTYNDRGKRVW